ncbi:MAG: alanine--tRNA ligase [Candidatus Shapirobacteria bacterium]|jgi:alanyl-tRNA synthetase
MTASELKAKFIAFFVEKGHVEIPSAPLVPENDPSTLFTSSGIQPLVPYFLGESHPVGKRLTNIQKCIRTGDIDEVGDSYHHTFFEMLGNWSLGDYFKSEAIPWSFEFLTKTLNISVDKLAVTCFAGNSDTEKDIVSQKLWLDLGLSPERINFLVDNWWGPPGVTGPCGTDTEMFYWWKDNNPPKVFDPKNPNWLEIWNDVLIQYLKNDQGKYEKLVQNNIDTGMGVERTIAVLNGFSDNYLTDIWQSIIKKIEEISGKSYQDLNYQKSFRIIADHIRSAVFIIADGVEPGNKEAGYVLRRLIRRSIRHGKLLGIEQNICSIIGQSVLDNQSNYAGTYPELNENKVKILSILEAEENRFRKSLDKGLNEINKLIKRNHKVTGKEAFDLYQNFGFPLELIKEELNKNNLDLDEGEFEKYKSDHIKLSQTLSAGKFKSGLADNSEVITKYHTATHLLHATLRQVLGNHVEQSGSNITADRLRFDFSHQEKLTPDQIIEVEKIVNQIISKNLPVTREEMKFTDAQNQGALAFFGHKYPEIVSVYTIDSFSKEVCTGPHVSATGEIGKLKITKEESAGSGKRRIYAEIVA